VQLDANPPFELPHTRYREGDPVRGDCALEGAGLGVGGCGSAQLGSVIQL
jgi:hypothetical protein